MNSKTRLPSPAEAQFDSAYTFEFSPREGTEAATMVEHWLPHDVVKDRFQRLDAVVRRSAYLAHQARVGRIERCLVEGPSRKDPTKITARTAQNKLIHFDPAGNEHAHKSGAYVDVEVTYAAPYHLMGVFKEFVVAPRHKTRVPVLVVQ